MPEFLELLAPTAALKVLIDEVAKVGVIEQISSVNSLGRVIAHGITAPFPLPGFHRSTVDGYAVRSVDTYAASESLPVYLKLIGEIPMGQQASIALGLGECALIHTGGMLPEGADAVVMVEFTQGLESGDVEILRSVAGGENILRIGEDVIKGQEVISPGVRIRAAEIGGLIALGILQVSVFRKPIIAIISSGDEVISPKEPLLPGQVYDVNSYSLAATITEAGGQPIHYGIVPDRIDSLHSLAIKALAESDMLIITAGSSASTRDLTAQVINNLGRPGVLVHGINIRPGKPTILAMCDSKPVIGLPGNPVSALVIALLFVKPVIHRLSGIQMELPAGKIRARLSLNLPSQAGREDWIPVHLSTKGDCRIAEPVLGKSNLIFTLVRANGLARIEADATGLSAGEEVEAILF